MGEAADGEEIVKLAEELQPDVILIDINMPRLNGIQATIKIVEADPDARVIVLTMYARTSLFLMRLRRVRKAIC